MSATAPLAPSVRAPIEPRWWTGSPALSDDQYLIDCASRAIDDADLDPDGALAREMRALFDETGLVVLKNTGLENAGRMRQLARLVIDAEMIYEGGANPRGRIQPNVYEVGAPLEAWLHYHHEMAYIGSSTTMLGFLCLDALPDRGWTFVSDNLRATDALLATPFGRKLKDRGLCYHRNLTDRDHFAGTEQIGVYNHWQQSMLTDDPDEAAAVAASRGLEVEWGPNRLLKTRYYVSAFEYFPAHDRNVLFSSIADDALWFDAWPRVSHLPDDERPLKLTFGDGSEMTEDEKRLFMDVYDRFGTPIQWHRGDVAVICNYRFAHGRPGIQLADGEARRLGVVIGRSFDRVGDLADKW